MSRKLKIVSWNIKNSAAHTVVTDHIKKLHDQVKADVYMLQELTVNSVYNPHTDAHTTIAEALGFDHRFVEHTHKVLRFQEGVGIFTHLPISNEHSYLLNNRRAILDLEVKINGSNITLVNVHVTAPAFNPTAYQKEAKMLPQKFERYLERTVIGGDFNSFPNTKLITKLADQFDIVGRDEPTWQSKILKSKASVDYVMSTHDIKLGEHRTLDQGPSDHLPVYVEVEV